MMNPWPHLGNPHLDPRVMLAAGFLANKIAGKHIVELNCGAAPILKYLPRTFASYYCNDVEDAIQTKAGIVFEQITDDKVPERLKDQPVDVLMCFGVSCWCYKPNFTIPEPADPCSKTIKDTIISIAKTHRPEFIILDNSRPWWTRGNLTGITDELQRCLKYKMLDRVFIGSDLIEDAHSDRVVEILNR